jgi:hypothetical protein
MNRGLLAALTVVSVAAGGVSLADRISAQAVATTGRLDLPMTATAEVPICPGPETLLAPEGATAVPAPGPVQVSAVAVPSAIGSPGGTGSTALAVALGALSATSDPEPGAVTGTGTVGGAAVVSTTATRPGALRTYTAEGEPVPAVAAAQWTLARNGDLRGLSTVSCQVAGTDLWLVGGGTRAGRRARLVLSNPSPTPAVVDLTIYGPTGIVRTPAASGVVVPATGQRALYVDALAPDLIATAIRVRASSGRVSAVLHDSLIRGTTPGGTDDVVPAAEPAHRQFVPGITVTAAASGKGVPREATAEGATAVRVVVPDTVDAVVRIHLYGPDGELELPGGGVLTVPGRSLTDLPLVGVPDGVYTAVVESDTPVVAGAVVGRFGTPSAAGEGDEDSLATEDTAWSPSDGAPDLGWAAATRTVTSLTVVALPIPEQFIASGQGRPSDTHAHLVLAGTGNSAGVRVTWLGTNGQGQDIPQIAIPAGRTVTVPVPNTAAGLVLRPEAGSEVVAAVVVTVDDRAGELVSVEPVRPGRVAGRQVPVVVEDPQVGVFPGSAPPRTG